MTPQDFQVICQFLKERSGIIITPDKRYLMETRLSPLIREHRLEGLADIAHMIRSNSNPALTDSVLDAMTTNETLFFRDIRPFDLLSKHVLPDITQGSAPLTKIRIWCAACSSGQEPYSIAIMLKEEQAKYANVEFEIVATDISHNILEKAQAGRYNQFEVQRGLPVHYLVKYFTKEGQQWVIKDDIKKMVTFRHFNLMDKPNRLGKFNVIFCRNVLIYFDPDTKTKILDNLSEVLTPNGYLTLGSSEDMLGLSKKFKPQAELRGFYRLTQPV